MDTPILSRREQNRLAQLRADLSREGADTATIERLATPKYVRALIAHEDQIVGMSHNMFAVPGQ